MHSSLPGVSGPLQKCLQAVFGRHFQWITLWKVRFAGGCKRQHRCNDVLGELEMARRLTPRVLLCRTKDGEMNLSPSLLEELQVMEQLASALLHAHRHGIAHGDVKTANVVMGADGRVLLIDWGFASKNDEDRTHWRCVAVLCQAPPVLLATSHPACMPALEALGRGLAEPPRSRSPS